MQVALDVDTGVDDGLAILLACRHPSLDLVAISCVAGNAGVDQVVSNTLKVLDVAAAPDIPVARGMPRPLVAPPGPARRVHGDDGMADLGLPASRRSVVGADAVELLRSTLATATEPITLIALGPLTNLAVLVQTYPELLRRLDRIVFVGGAVEVDDATSAREFNLRHDPEAAATVLGCGVPLTMYGLEVFLQATVSAAEVGALCASDDPAARLAGLLLRHQLARTGGTAAALGDAGAVAAVLRPDLLETVRRHVRIELADPSLRGRTVVDPAPTNELDHDGHAVGGPVEVALEADGAALTRLFLDALRGP